jgi:subtilisin family serine protease
MKDHLYKSLLVAVLLLWCGTLSSQNPQEKIAPEIERALRSGPTVECIVTFRAAADLSDLPAIRGKVQKGRTVWQRLTATAAASQRSVRSLLDRAGHSYRSFAIVNALYLRADRQLVDQLAARTEVAYLQANPWVQPLEQQPVPEAAPRGVANWGLDKIRAPEVWAQGITGAGVVIGHQDTGVEWTHPALKTQYRGWQGSDGNTVHSYHWFDAIDAVIHPDLTAPNPCGWSSASPCDDHGHGTATLGIAVGDDGGDRQIGVAPGARWIACRNMDRGFGSPASYLAAFEWFLAPTDEKGQNPRPELAPHVINNSWSCPREEGCSEANWHILRTAIRHLRAAGVVVVVSAGNRGPACNSIVDPPAIFSDAFVVGSTNSLDNLAKHSSRGPVTIGPDPGLKPDVVAPGVNVLTATIRGTAAYANVSGTSAAGPFAAGVVALLIEANPQLAGEVDRIEDILRETAVPATADPECGGYRAADIPNPLTGYGRIDAFAAVQRAKALLANPPPTLPVRAYPNPVSATVYFESAGRLRGAQVEIFDVTGRRVDEFEITTYPPSRDLSRWPAGCYWWRLTYREAVATGKLIKP